MIAGEPLARTAHTGLNLVDNQDDVVCSGYVRQCFEKSLRGNDDATGPLNWLDPDSRGRLVGAAGTSADDGSNLFERRLERSLRRLGVSGARVRDVCDVRK